MAESLFLDTIPRWYRKIRPKKTVEPESSAEDDRSDPIQNLSDLLSSTLSDINPAARAEAEEETAAQAESEESRLDQDLARDVFGSSRSAPDEEDVQQSSPPEPKVATVSQISAQADQQEIESMPEHQVRRASAAEPEADAQEVAPAEPLIQPESQVGTGAPAEAGKLDPELLQNVFSRPAPPPEEVSTPESPVEPLISQTPTTGVYSEAAESPPPQVRQVRAGTTEGESVKLTELFGQKEQKAATPPSSGEVEDSLPLTLKDIFRKKVVINPQIKALLERHGEVDTKELAKELDDFAESIGARKSSPSR